MQTKTSVGRDFQDNILGRLAERRQVTTIYLRNRMSLRGWVIEFDPYVLLLEPLDGSPPQMVYKSAVVSISGPRRFGPSRPEHGRGGPGREGGPPRPRPPHRGWPGPESLSPERPQPGNPPESASGEPPGGARSENP